MRIVFITWCGLAEEQLIKHREKPQWHSVAKEDGSPSETKLEVMEVSISDVADREFKIVS